MFPDLSEELIRLIIRITSAAFLGGLIGLERYIHGRDAGLRTHLLVSMGSAVFMLMSEHVASLGRIDSGGITGMVDPGRIAAQIVTGIGFLGAGVIIKEGINVRGLTTAACLWTAAGIGMACGAGYFALAITATIIALFSLVGFMYCERFYPRDSYRILTVVTTNNIDASAIIDIVKNKGLDIINYNFERNYDTGTTSTRLSIRLFHRGITDKVSHGVIRAFERSEIPLKAIEWDRR